MSDNVLKIILPNFEEPNGIDNDSFLIEAKIGENIVGCFSIYPFDRFDFIDQTGYDYEEFCYFARRLELFQRPYLNDNGLMVMVINRFIFEPTYDIGYKTAFLRDAVKRIAEKLYENVADIYILAEKDNIKICEKAGFEIMDEDEEYGIWMHYIGFKY